jgi:hypothetical protein
MSLHMSPEARQAIASKFSVLARGAGGIGELAESLPEDDASVLWGLVTCIIGSGTFARTKYVMVSMSGGNCAPIRRMKANEFKMEAGMCLGLDCVDFPVAHRSEVTMDSLLELLLKVCVSDDAKADVTASSIKRDLEEQARKAMMALRERRESSVIEYNGPRTIVAMGKKISVPKVVEYVQKPNGPLNWVIIDHKKNLVEAGGGSVHEMCQFFDPKEVQFGLLRMGFGSGQFKRNFWLFIHWSGESTAKMRRGSCNAELPNCKQALQPSQIDFYASDVSEITVDIIIKKVLTYCRVDGDTSKDGKNPFTIEAFNEALHEDMKQLEEEFGLAEMAAQAASDDDDMSKLKVEEAVRAVRDPNNPYNWLLIQGNANAKPGTGATTAVKALGRMSLKKVETNDKSAPDRASFTDFKLKRTSMPSVMADIAGGATQLKKVDTDDKSGPVIDSTVKVEKHKRGSVLDAIKNLETKE